jgi:hypothetical protein
VGTLTAIVLALTAAATYAVAAVLQQRVASTADKADSMRLRLFVRLARNRLWVLATLLEVASYGLQATALYFGPLTLVAPLAGLDLVFALPLIASSRRASLSLREWASAGCVVGGVAIFLAVSPPSAGIPSPPFLSWLPLLAAVVGLLLIGMVAIRRSDGLIRAGTLAAMAGVEFGIVAALSKSFVDEIGRLGLGALAEWQPYMLAVFGILGTLLAQSAYQAGSLAVSLPIIDTVEPISSVAIGATLFQEKLASSVPLLSAQLLGAAVAVLGIVAIDRSVLVREPPTASGSGTPAQ